MDLSAALIDAPAAGLRWSASIVDADTGEVLARHRADRVQSTASVGKLLLLAAASRAIDAGELDPRSTLSRGEERIADSGIWHAMDVESLAVDDVCRLIGAVSDNLATNILLDRVGLDAVAEVAHHLGLGDVALLDRVRDPRMPEHPPTLSQGSAGELARLAAALDSGFPRVIAWLRLGADLSMVAGAFGLDPLAHADADRGIRLWNKTGTDAGVRADVGVVRTSARGLAYAVLAQWNPDASEDPRDDVLNALRTVGIGIRGALAVRGGAVHG